MYESYKSTVMNGNLGKSNRKASGTEGFCVTSERGWHRPRQEKFTQPTTCLKAEFGKDAWGAGVINHSCVAA